MGKFDGIRASVNACADEQFSFPKMDYCLAAVLFAEDVYYLSDILMKA
jgi:hypothetical protein